MSDKKITDIADAANKKREKDGWTMDDLHKFAVNELREYDKIAENEPKNFVSGDPSKMHDEDEDENHDKKK